MTASNGAVVGGRYRLHDLIGQGGMGRVWRGRDETLGRDVAVKEVLLPDGVDDEHREQLLQRTLREALAAARLNHPGIITVHDVVEHEGAPVIVMEYVTGSSLAALLGRDGALPVRRVAEIGAAMLKALQQAHAAGIVHRDLKPDNVLLMDERVILTDFGIAHMADATTALTRTGAVIGTPAYMAPEQLEGKPPTAANDLWSLGATLYAAVEGQAPFHADTFSALCIAVVTQPPRPTQRAGALGPVLTGLLTKDPAQRLTAEQALAALESVVRGEAAPVVPPPTRVDAPPLQPGFGPPLGYPAPEPNTAHLRSVLGTMPHREPTPGGGFVPHQQPAPPYPPSVAPTADGAVAARRGNPAVARLVRFLGSMVALWAVGLLMPWNELRWMAPSYYLPVIVVTAVFSLGHALPRPRLHAGLVWVLFFVFDVAMFYFDMYIESQGFLGMRGYSPVPGPILVNSLIVATCVWLLWWKVPGSRRS
ncbi:protein kinase [Streptomyces sp. SP17BM10]|uniref:serine/threonine-protein kinase n=1 Tax=Streptomyces sp. SP17BM10 TaxID=3002530 RepID=UPI002E76A486|nr:protein kinase [Streptomyces sp. SP17BM10]MEE1783490.1 protein kinase [Streptomyces sp. SP17BM10]